ncbi:MAG: helix-turn-helix transcriptional regulator [Thermoleophilia bacterium]|nr:helix-turn-helix transcriptional regulator [Thermoleophilia bacterium]
MTTHDPRTRHARRHAEAREDPEYVRAFEQASREVALTQSLLKALDAVRELRGLSKQDLAGLVGRPPSSIRRLFGRASTPNPELRTVMAMLDAFDASIVIRVGEAPETDSLDFGRVQVQSDKKSARE